MPRWCAVTSCSILSQLRLLGVATASTSPCTRCGARTVVTAPDRGEPVPGPLLNAGVAAVVPVLDDGHNADAERVAHGGEFHEVESSLSAFVVGDERLGSVEQRGDICLSESGAFAVAA